MEEWCMDNKVGIIGSGEVGLALANGFIKHGYKVMVGTSDPHKHEKIREKTKGVAQAGSFEETARFGTIIVFVPKGAGAESAIKKAGPANLAGKTVIDVTNPISEKMPVNGVLEYFTGPNESLMERLQKLAPEANFVKCFSCINSAYMVNPDFGSAKPTMFICGNNESAKRDVIEILNKFGQEYEDMGKVEAARAIEPLAMLYCIRGFLRNDWNHAFKLLRK
jgi:predicted dinucleotide-binding enzyme